MSCIQPFNYRHSFLPPSPSPPLHSSTPPFLPSFHTAHSWRAASGRRWGRPARRWLESDDETELTFSYVLSTCTHHSVMYYVDCCPQRHFLIIKNPPLASTVRPHLPYACIPPLATTMRPHLPLACLGQKRIPVTFEQFSPQGVNLARRKVGQYRRTIIKCMSYAYIEWYISYYYLWSLAQFRLQGANWREGR